MKLLLSIAASLFLGVACNAQPLHTLAELQGAWWSDKNNPTADFAITDDRVWLDFDAQYHPCEIAGDDILVFDLGQENGRVEHKIIRLDDSTLVLENVVTRAVVVYTRAE